MQKVREIIEAAASIREPFYADDPPQAIIDYEGVFTPEHVALMEGVVEAAAGGHPDDIDFHLAKLNRHRIDHGLI